MNKQHLEYCSSDEWADAVKKAGIKRVEGCVVGDGSYLAEEGPHPAELWEDAGNYYAGMVSGLCFNDNLYAAEFSGAPSPGRPVTLRGTSPAHTGIERFDNRLLTAGPESRDSAFILGGFPSPVRVGSRIRLHGTVDSVEDVPGDGVQLAVDFTVKVEGSTRPACVARALYRYYPA